MKKLSFAGIGLLALAAAARPAAAADLEPMYYGAPPPVMLFSWTGFYFGAHVGGAWAHKDFGNQTFGFGGVTYIPVSASIDPSGWLAGGQIGAQFQTGSWVLGFEADASWANLSGSSNCSSIAGPALVANCNAQVNTIGTVAGRLGFALDRLLIYGKGGAAWANDKYQLNSSVLNFQANETRWGWMVGVGAEYAFTDSWSAKIEYNYIDFTNRSTEFTDTTDQVNLNANIRQNVQVVKTGVNYRFGWAPVGVRY
jgi:outer membrane immunogenic protein